MTKNVLSKFGFLGAIFVATVGFPLISASNAFAQLPAPAVPAAPGAPAPTAEVERVVVTGSNIPTAEETGPNPVDTYRPQDIEKLGIRSAVDLQEFIPQEAGGTVNTNMGNGGDGTIQFNLRGLLPKETLVLIDGKRVAYGSLGVAGFSGGPDINLIPFSMIDHVDILKDGASAVYGSDAIAGVINFFLVHKFRGLEIGGTYGNTNMGASNDMGEWEAWIKAGTGDDKTDIVVIADFFQRTVAFSVVTAIFLPTGSLFPLEDLMREAAMNLAAFKVFACFPLCFSVTSLRGHIQLLMPRVLHFTLIHLPFALLYREAFLTLRAVATTSSITSPLLRQRCRRETVKCTTPRSPATCAINT
jgi:TonB-dependent Receptor Plug Domain